MIVLEGQPHITDLHKLISQVPSYPISVGRLIKLASLKRTNREVINFYKIFPSDSLFMDKNDIEARTEQLEILLTESQPAEDEVRGAED